MFTNKLSMLLLAAIVSAITLAIVSFVAAPKSSELYQDYALRHPGGLIIPITGNLDTSGSDYYQRHPELSAPVRIDAGYSDYFERHPDLSAPAGTSFDTTDYYFRHPELSGASNMNVDLTDYYFRHINNRFLP